MKDTKKICLFVLVLLLACFAACESGDDAKTYTKTVISEDILREDAEFIKKIEALPYNLFVDYAPLDDLDEMLSWGDQTEISPNLIVRCEVISRGETAVISPLSTYTNDDLKSANREYVGKARDAIRTPYEMKIQEVYHGTVNDAGDIIPIVAPYGEIDGFVNRSTDYPIYSVGSEYILFFNVYRRFEELKYSLFYTPCGWIKLDSEKGTFECDDFARSMYSEYGNSMDKLIKDLKKLIKSKDLRTEMESFGDIEDALEFKRQKDSGELDNENNDVGDNKADNED